MTWFSERIEAMESPDDPSGIVRVTCWPASTVDEGPPKRRGNTKNAAPATMPMAMRTPMITGMGEDFLGGRAPPRE